MNFVNGPSGKSFLQHRYVTVQSFLSVTDPCLACSMTAILIFVVYVSVLSKSKEKVNPLADS